MTSSRETKIRRLPLAKAVSIAILTLPVLGIAQEADESTDSDYQLEEVIVTAEKVVSTAQETSRAISVIGLDEIQDTAVITLGDALQNVPGFGFNATMGQASMRGVGLDLTDTGQMASLVSVNVDGAASFGGARGGSSSGIENSLFDVERIEVIRGPSGTMVGQNALAGSVNIVTRRPTLNDWSFNTSIGYGDYSKKLFTFGGNVPLGETFALRVAYSKSEHDCYSKRTDGTKTVCGNNWEDIEQARARVLWQPTDNFSIMLTANYTQDSSQFDVSGDPNSSNPWLTFGAPANVFPPPPPGVDLVSEPTRNPGPKDYNYSAEVIWDTNYGTLTVLPTYTKSKPFAAPLPDFCGVVVPIGQFPCAAPQDEERKGFEARFNSRAGERLEWVVGVLKDEQTINSPFTVGGDVELSYNTFVMTPNVVSILSSYGMANPGVVPAYIDGARTFPPRNTESAYGNLTFHVTDDLRLKAGMRYAKDNTGGSYQAAAYGLGIPAGGVDASMWYYNPDTNPDVPQGTTVIGLPNPTDYPNSNNADWTCLNCVTAFVEEPYQYEGETNPNNYSAGFEYDVNDSSMVYANWNTGYQPGGVEAFFVPVRLYPSQRINAYAFGSKNRFMDNRLELNAEAYIYDYENWHGNTNTYLEIVYPFEGTTYVEPDLSPYAEGGPQNGTLPYPVGYTPSGKTYRNVIPSMTHYGLEVDMRALLTPNDSITANVALLHHKFEDYIDSAGNNYKGQRLANAPAISARLSYQHDFQVFGGTLVPRFDVKYQSETLVSNERSSPFDGSSVLDAVTQPSFWKYDAYLNYTYQTRGGVIGVNMYVKNIADTAEKVSAFPFPFALPRITDPRTWGITLSYSYN